MIIDCDTCAVRGDACGDCVVGVLLGVPDPATRPDSVPSGASVVQLDAPETRAIQVLADQGLVPRLRLVSTRRPTAPRNPESGDPSRNAG